MAHFGIGPYTESWPVQVRQKRFATPERPPDWEPTLSEEPGFFEQLPGRATRTANALADFLWGTTPEETASGDLMGAVMGTPLMLRGPVAKAVYNPRTQQELVERVLSQLEGVNYDNPLQAFLLSNVLKRHPRLTAAYGHHGGTIRTRHPGQMPAGNYSALGAYRSRGREPISADTSREMGPLIIAEPGAELTLAGQLQELASPGPPPTMAGLIAQGFAPTTSGGSTIPISVGAHEVGHLAQDLPESATPAFLGSEVSLAEHELGARITGANQMIRFLNPTMKAKERMQRALGDALLTQSWGDYLKDLSPDLSLSIQGRRTTVGEVLRWLDDPTPDAPFLPKDFKFHSGPSIDRQRLLELRSRDRTGLFGISSAEEDYLGTEGIGFDPEDRLRQERRNKELEDLVSWQGRYDR